MTTRLEGAGILDDKEIGKYYVLKHKEGSTTIIKLNLDSWELIYDSDKWTEFNYKYGFMSQYWKKNPKCYETKEELLLNHPEII